MKTSQSIKTIVSFLFSISLVLVVTGQSTISGTVVSEDSGEPLIGASIAIPGSITGTVTDLEGNFSLIVSAEFPVKVSVSYTGFETREIIYDDNSPQTIELVEGVLWGNEIIVSASRKAEKAVDAPASTSVIEARKITSQALVSPAFALRNTPGVDVTYQGVDHIQINLRGRNDAFQTETYFMLDNRSLIVPGQGVSILSRNALNELDLDRIEIVRGPGSALYGPGVETGVVHFLSKSPFKYKGTSLSIGTGTKANISFAGRHAGLINDKWGYKILGHYNRANDFVLDPDDPIDAESLAAFQPQVFSGLTGELLRPTNELEDVVWNYSFSGALEYQPNKSTSVTASAGYTRRRGLVRAGLGEALQDYPLLYGQIRINSGNFFAQAYANITINDQERDVLYRTGFTSITNNVAYDVQAQNVWELLDDQLDVTLGGEIQLIRTDSKGTVHGRFEDDDNFDIYSGYAQAEYLLSPKFEVIGALRIDRFSAINETTLSPRAALVYRLGQNQTLRASFNRAITSPSALWVYADIPFGVSPAFDIPFIGGIVPIQFSDPINTSSFLPGVGNYAGTDLSLNIPFNTALESLGETLSPEVLIYLGSRATQVSGTTAGALLLNNQIISALPERGQLQSTKTSAFELGYKGIFGGSVSVGLDVYYNRRRDLVFISSVSPLVLYPSLAADLAAEVGRITDPNELSALGTTQQEVQDAFSAIGEGLAAGPLGLVQPDIDFQSTQPQFVVTPNNTGQVNYFGADFSLQYYASSELSVFFNYSWLEQSFYTDEEIGLPGTGLNYSLNTPENRIRAGIDFIPENEGFSYNASVRYQDSYEVEMGTIFSGVLDSYTIVDAGFGYKFSNGLNVVVTGQNIFNNEYRVMPRMPKIGTLVLVKAMIDL